MGGRRVWGETSLSKLLGISLRLRRKFRSTDDQACPLCLSLLGSI